MKLTKFFVGFFAVAAMALTTSCLSSKEGPEVVSTPTMGQTTVTKASISNSGTTVSATTEAGTTATANITAAEVAGLSSDADVTLTVQNVGEAVSVTLTSSDDSQATIPGGGVEVKLSGLEANTSYTLDDGSTVVTDAQGNATVTVKSFGKPVTLTKKTTPSHSGGQGQN